MRKIRNFKCDKCQSHFEKLVEDESKIVACPCKGWAKRQLSAPRCFGNTTGKSPSSSYRKGV